MSTKTDISKKAVIQALKESLGIVTQACQSVGIDRSTYYDWMKADEQFKSDVDSIQDIAIDYVEGKLYENIENNDVTSIIFYLKSKAKKRGYVERQEVEHSGKIIQIIYDGGINNLINPNSSSETAH